MEIPPAATRLLTGAGVRFAYLFGSRSTGTHTPGSDADIAIMPGRPLTLLDESRLAVDLADEFKVPEVDLVDLGRAPLRLLGRVLAEGTVIHGFDEPERVAFEVLTRSRYFDFLPMQRRAQEAYLRRVAAGGPGG